MVEGKVRTVSVHSVWWRARYVQLVYTQCGGGQVRIVSAHSVWWRARYVQLVYTRCGGGQGTYS